MINGPSRKAPTMPATAITETTTRSRARRWRNSSRRPAPARADSLGRSAAWTAWKRKTGTRAIVRPARKRLASPDSDGSANSSIATGPA